VPVRQPDLGCHYSRIHHQLRRRKEDEDWLYELSIDMFAEDGCLRVYGVREDGVTAFTEYGIECLKQIIADERETGKARPPIQSAE
jgi:hypothetical protein